MKLENFFFDPSDVEFVHEQSLKVLAETGCVFDDEKALDIFRKHGARVDGVTVYFTKEPLGNAALPQKEFYSSCGSAAFPCFPYFESDLSVSTYKYGSTIFI